MSGLFTTPMDTCASKGARAPHFFKGGLGRKVCLGMSGTRRELAPAVALEQPVDRRGGHFLAHLGLVGLLDLGDREHPTGVRALGKWLQKLPLLLNAQVLAVSAASRADIKDGIPLLGPARVQHMHGGR